MSWSIWVALGGLLVVIATSSVHAVFLLARIRANDLKHIDLRLDDIVQRLSRIEGKLGL